MASYYNWTVDPFTWHTDKKTGLYVIDNDFTISFTDEANGMYMFLIKKGAMTDGGSIPKIFSWIAPSWSDDYKYNATFVLHDGLYGSALLPRLTADDILRSSLRDCGLSRWQASTICTAVNKFACKHYGVTHDKYNIRKYISRVK